jgi:hypothetical protein
MPQLDIVQDRLEYVGLLAAPAFRVFANQIALASGLYQAFQGYHSGIDNINFEGESAKPLQRSCVVDLGDHGTYRLSLERVEWTRTNAWAYQLASTVLGQGDAWLRQLGGGAPLMHSHYFTYSAHVFPIGSAPRDVLMGIGGPALQGFGDNEGTGVIFHTRNPVDEHELQLTIDHSHDVQGGLFIEMLIVFEHDSLDFVRTGPFLVDTLRRALKSVDLEVFTGVG